MRSNVIELPFVARRERRGRCHASLSVRSAACRTLYSGVVAEPISSPCALQNLAPGCLPMIGRGPSGAAQAHARLDHFIPTFRAAVLDVARRSATGKTRP